MSDPTDTPTPKPALRGEAAWRAQRDSIEARNNEAKKQGQEKRAAFEQQREGARLAAEGREERRFLANRPDS
jgi:hypothetical protein